MIGFSLRWWFGTHAALIVLQVVLVAASGAAQSAVDAYGIGQVFDIVRTGNWAAPTVPFSPVASIAVSIIAVVFNALIVFAVYRLHRPSPTATDESRRHRCRYVVTASAIFAVAITCADFAFAAKFADFHGASGAFPAACALAAIAGYVAPPQQLMQSLTDHSVGGVAAVVVDVGKIYQDGHEARNADKEARYQYDGYDRSTGPA